MGVGEVVGLCGGDCIGDVDDGEFVASDAAGEDLVFSGGGIEVPLAVGVVFERDGEGVVVGADEQHLGAVGHFAPAVHDAVAGDECVGGVLVLHGVAGVEDVFRVGTEDCHEGVLIAGFCCCEERTRGVVGRGKGAERRLFWRLGVVAGGKGKDERENQQPGGERDSEVLERHSILQNFVSGLLVDAAGEG